MLDGKVVNIVDAAVEAAAAGAGAGDAFLTRSDVMYLLRFDAYSAEAAYVCAKAREVGMRACRGKGYLYAQIGVDSTACPENCRFCSFAAMNTSMADYDPSQVEVPLGRIVHYAKLFDDAGVHLISLMATAGLPFERYLDMVRAVRTSVSPEMTVMANAGDLTLGEAHALKEAGATAAYHALRLGEGEITDIQPIDRLRTIRYLHAAGIPLMTGVEPVWDGVDNLALSERICDIPEFDPFCVGACSLTEVAGAAVGKMRPALTGFVRYVGALVRLVCGESVPVGGIGGVAWIDAGCDPRARGYGADDDTLRKQIAKAKRRLELDGFQVGSPQGR